MNKEVINALVFDYRNGDITVLDEIFRKINPLIENASRIVEKVCDNPTKFDCRVILKLKKALNDSTIKDFDGYAKTIIGNEKSDFLTRRKREQKQIVMSALEGASEEDLGYQFESNESVEDDVLFKERVNLLAQGNLKKQTILLQWSKGAEDKAISQLLAQLYEGKAEAHRKFIQRFKDDCRRRITKSYV